MLHPKIAHRSGDPFLEGRFDDAIFNALKLVEHEVRTKIAAKADLVGTKLMSEAFGGTSPRLLISNVPAEQEGAHSLFRGAIALLKNPASHRFPDVDDPTATFEILIFASLLMRYVESAELRPGTTPPTT
jgi:uncharacterized protein (TIGR02391 family)